MVTVQRILVTVTGILGMTLASPAVEPQAPAPAPGQPLLIHVGGTMRPAMERICELYKKETGGAVELNYNDSGALMTVIATSGKGDACILHDPFPAVLQKRGLVDRSYTVAALTPVIVVRKGNPRNVRSVADLARPDVRVGLTDAVYSTAGHVVARVFQRAGIAEAMAARDAQIVRTRSGGEIANAVGIGSVDAAIVWNAVAFARGSTLDAVPIAAEHLPRPGVDAVTSATYGPLDMSCTRVILVTLTTSKQIEVARRFAEFAASERGQDVFREFGFSDAAPAAKPALGGALFVYCAAGVRDAVVVAARQFEADTGVKVEMTLANSGQLLGQIQTTRQGDVYIPGDIGFTQQAQKRGLVRGEPRRFCYFVPVILVRKGNPKGIRELADLVRPGIRLALADDSAAIGKLQTEVFRKNRLDQNALTRNRFAAPPTVTDVALAVKLGSVDAGMVWDVTGRQYAADADTIQIPPAMNVYGTVTAAVLSVTKNAPAAAAFVDFLSSEQGRAILRQAGFSVEPPLQTDATKGE